MEWNEPSEHIICKNCESFKEGLCLKDSIPSKVEETQSCASFEAKEISGELKDCYYTIIDILKKYCDLEERYYPIVALWIIGTYIHDEFETFPYLYLNAIKGSGKSRLLKLIAELCKNGRMIGSLTESVLFRNAKGRTFCVDEFENIDSDDKHTLRELLNSAYKKGMIIERSKKVRRKNEKTGENEETYSTETFDVYTSIAIANIWGMEEVLGDRCITLILEKSSNVKITKLIEIFKKDFSIQKIKGLLEEIKDNLCSLVTEKNMAQDWNNYISGLSNEGDKKLHLFFKRVDEIGIEGRNLELMLPLYFIAYLIDEQTLDKALEISKEIVKEREEEDYFENKDKIFMRFLSEKLQEGNLEYLNYISITKLTNQFKEYEGEGNDWINSKWIGKALKRMKLIKDKKRETKGIKVLLNLEKAKIKTK